MCGGEILISGKFERKARNDRFLSRRNRAFVLQRERIEIWGCGSMVVDSDKSLTWAHISSIVAAGESSRVKWYGVGGTCGVK